MGPRKILALVAVFLAISVIVPDRVFSQVLAQPAPPPSVSLPPPPSEAVTPWMVFKQKIFPNYKVEILQRRTIGKQPRVESMEARIIPNDSSSVTEYAGTWLNPDPKIFVVGWQGGLLDMDADGLEDLVLQNFSAGAHCCFNYVIYSLSKPLKKLGNLEMKDCGEQITLQDLNGDKKPEVIACNADFTYLGKLPYSDSPFPPAVYTLAGESYRRADKEFQQVFLADIQTQRAELAKGYSPSGALQIAIDYFLIGNEAQGWKEFDTLYRGDDKETIRAQLLKKIGKPTS